MPAGSRTRLHYGVAALCLHWLMALLLGFLLWLGFHVGTLSPGAERSALIALHKSLGLAAGLLLLVRLAWRHVAPVALSAVLPPWQRRLANTSHRLLYALMLLLPVSGYLRAAYSPYRMAWFGMPLPRLVPPDQLMNQLFARIHEVAAYGLMALLLVHVIAAAMHWLSGNPLLTRRMLRVRPAAPVVPPERP